MAMRRCENCGRQHVYMRSSGLCPLCFNRAIENKKARRDAILDRFDQFYDLVARNYNDKANHPGSKGLTWVELMQIVKAIKEEEK